MTEMMIDPKTITVGLMQEAAQDFSAEVSKAVERIDVQLPHMLFQETHTTGWLWNKKTYYKYFKYSEGSMHQVNVYSQEIIDRMKNRK